MASTDRPTRTPAPADRRGRAPGRALVAALAVGGLLLGACSSDGSDGARGPSTTAADGTATTTGGAEGTEPEGGATAIGANPCDQGATVDAVEAVAVDGTPSDRAVTSFDGTEIRIHWFTTEATDEPAPTILMGPGWSLPGDTTLDNGQVIFGALSITPMLEAGYNVLTWDPRGFGESTGKAEVNSPEAEGRDVQVLLDWVAEQPEAQVDGDGDPRVGMVGFSYGGGIQLTTAAIDCRIDALVPGLAWHSLETSLYKNETVKAGWAGTLSSIAGDGNVDPHVTSASASGLSTGLLADEDLEWFRTRGPGDLVDDITVPTLFVQGTVDTLFTLDEAITNQRSLLDRDVPTAMLWFCGGHGACLVDPGDTEAVATATFAWLDRHLKGDESVDTGPAFSFVDQDGTRWTADGIPEPDAELTAGGAGSLTLDGTSVAGPITVPAGEADVLSGLVAPFTPSPAALALEVYVQPGDLTGMALGAPHLTLTYSGTAPDGEEPTRVFAQLVDDELGVVVGNQITPIDLVLDGETHTVEVDLEVIAQRITDGETLTLQLVATTPAYAEPRLGGQLTVTDLALTIPVVTTGLTEVPSPEG